jgi:hypothetical protein
MNPLPVEQIHIRLSLRRPQDVAISEWLANRDEGLSLSAVVREALYWYILFQQNEDIATWVGQGSSSQKSSSRLAEIDPEEQVAKNLWGAANDEWS